LPGHGESLRRQVRRSLAAETYEARMARSQAPPAHRAQAHGRRGPASEAYRKAGSDRPSRADPRAGRVYQKEGVCCGGGRLEGGDASPRCRPVCGRTRQAVLGRASPNRPSDHRDVPDGSHAETPMAPPSTAHTRRFPPRRGALRDTAPAHPTRRQVGHGHHRRAVPPPPHRPVAAPYPETARRCPPPRGQGQTTPPGLRRSAPRRRSAAVDAAIKGRSRVDLT
jgi:hypothetical protein